MDDNNQQNKGSGTKDDKKKPINDGSYPVKKKKKPKTEAQIARERARRKRRRQNKKAVAKPGQDLPLFIGSDEGTAAGLEAPPDANAVATDAPPDFGESDDFVPAASEDIPTAKPEKDLPDVPEMMSPSEMEDSQKVFEESPVYLAAKGDDQIDESTPIPEDVSVFDKPSEESMDEVPENVPMDSDTSELKTDFTEEIPPNESLIEEEEVVKKEEALKQAQELSDNLVTEEIEELEEIPQKQGLMGKLFDAITGLSTKGKDVSARAEVNPDHDYFESGATLEEAQEGGGLLGKIVKLVFTLIVVLTLVVAAFWLGSSLKLMDHIGDLFSGGDDSQIELNVGENQQVVIDEQLQRVLGFKTAYVLGRNQGDSTDVVYNTFFNANYFGKLKDPVFYGETGVTAALFFGFGKDVEFFKNRFVFYVKYLEKLNLANKVSVNDVLDGEVRRDEALDNFIVETKELFERGNELRKEINVQVDDLKVSTNSLNPDKSRYEVDFFSSLQKLEAAKADTLLSKFIEVTQQQVELKAKLAAMSKLSEYYESVLIDMKLRLEAVEKNREALISGVTVTETPGVDLDLIR